MRITSPNNYYMEMDMATDTTCRIYCGTPSVVRTGGVEWSYNKEHYLDSYAPTAESTTSPSSSWICAWNQGTIEHIEQSNMSVGTATYANSAGTADQLNLSGIYHKTYFFKRVFVAASIVATPTQVTWSGGPRGQVKLTWSNYSYNNILPEIKPLAVFAMPETFMGYISYDYDGSTVGEGILYLSTQDNQPVTSTVRFAVLVLL